MTNPVSDEIYRLTEAALRAGQEHVPVHVFPFRMTEANLAAHQESDWQPFWRNLKQGYDSFETTRRPPRVSVCEGRYHFEDAGPGEVGAERPLAVCAATAAALEALEQSPPPAPTDPAVVAAGGDPQGKPGGLAGAGALRRTRGPDAVEHAGGATRTGRTRQAARARDDGDDRSSTYACSLTRASCRKFVALTRRQVALGLPAAPAVRARRCGGGRMPLTMLQLELLKVAYPQTPVQ